MLTLAPALLALFPLSIAAGIDLYLTLLFLGAAPTTGLWDGPLPGALSDLDSPSVLIVVGVFYTMEFTAERYPPAALVWNAFHAVIRPVSGFLLGLLILDGQPLATQLLGSVLAGATTSVAHAVRSGGAVVRWLSAVTGPHVLLVSLLEDVIVLGMVALTLDRPDWALAAAGLLVITQTPRLGSRVRAFAFAVRLFIGRVFQTLTQTRWLGPDSLPEWVRASLDDDDVLAPGGALRGTPAAAYSLPQVPAFVTGWVLIRGGSPVLVYRRRGTVHRLGLGFEPNQIAEHGFFRRVDLKTGDDSIGSVYFNLWGPGMASLKAEFAPGKKTFDPGNTLL